MSRRLVRTTAAHLAMSSVALDRSAYSRWRSAPLSLHVWQAVALGASPTYRLIYRLSE